MAPLVSNTKSKYTQISLLFLWAHERIACVCSSRGISPFDVFSFTNQRKSLDGELCVGEIGVLQGLSIQDAGTKVRASGVGILERGSVHTRVFEGRSPQISPRKVCVDLSLTTCQKLTTQGDCPFFISLPSRPCRNGILVDWILESWCFWQ